jgi:hypothetical protein
LIALGIVVLGLGMSIGCGSQATPTSKNTGEMKAEQQTQDIDAAIKSGKLDPKTYGRQ